MATNTSNRQIAINLACSIAAMTLGYIISFWLSPFIVKHIGVEANGFISLASNFVAYAGLVLVALNSMAGRFITISYVKKDYEQANLYFNSVYWGNVLMGFVMIVLATVVILNLNHFIDIPIRLDTDVKILFTLVFASFIISRFFPSWGISTYITNRLDRFNIPAMIISIVRSASIFLIFTMFTPHLWYMSFIGLLMMGATLTVDYYNCRTLTPELAIATKKGERVFSWKVIKELLASGIWNTITQVGFLLLQSVDMIISNIFLGPVKMGIVALSYALPNIIKALPNTLNSTFAPEITINYAVGDRAIMYRNITRSMKITSILLTIPLAMMLVYGQNFYSLWVPSQDSHLLYTLSALSLISLYFTTGVQILHNVFTTVNRVKEFSLVFLSSGVASASIAVLFCKYTDYGLYAIVTVSAVINMIRNIVYMVPVTSRYLGFKWYTFMPNILISVASVFMISVLGYGIKQILPDVSGWSWLVMHCAIMGLVGLIANSYIVLSKHEREFLFNKVLTKIKRHK